MSAAPSRLNRWSRMKAESRAGARGMKFKVPGAESDVALEDAPSSAAEEVAAQAAPEAVLEPSVDAQTPPGEAETAAEADLPNIDDLDAESDFTPFMSDKVSDAVRNMALRKLWRTNAVFANLDGLLDYGEDFTDAATVVTGMQSIYKVGRGMVDYEAEEAAKAAKAAEAEAEANAVETDAAALTETEETGDEQGAEDHSAAVEGAEARDDLDDPDARVASAEASKQADDETGLPGMEPLALSQDKGAAEVIGEQPDKAYQVVQRPDQD